MAESGRAGNMVPRGSAIKATTEHISTLAAGEDVWSTKPPPGVKRLTWGVILSQLRHAGVLERKARGIYLTTKDSAGMDPTHMAALWRDACHSGPITATKRRKKGATAPPPEEVEVDALEVLRKLGLRPALDLLMLLAAEEFHAVDDSAQVKELEVALAGVKSDLWATQAKAARLSSELLEARRSVSALREEVNKAKMYKPEVIEKRVLVGPVVGGRDQGAAGGGRVHMGSGHTMRMHKKPHAPTAGGIVSVYRKRRK